MTMMKLQCYCLCLLLTTGCGPDRSTVSGTVTYQGTKVPDGTISFLTAGRVFEGEIRDGAYEIQGVPAGEAIVTVIRLDPKQPDPYDTLAKVRHHMAEKSVTDAKKIAPNVVVDPQQLAFLQKKRHMLPVAYSVPETSDLRCMVSGARCVCHIALHEKSPPDN
jgi:hypothetical protein